MFKKTFKLVGIILLLFFSFIYTDKVFSTAENKNVVMKEVIKYKDKYDIKPVEPKKNGDEIVLGYSGLIIDKKKSYKNMDDKFDKNKLIYNTVLPNNSITKSFDYYIKQGNPNNKNVSIIFKVNSNKNLEAILKSADVKLNFFVDGKWLEDNIELAFKMVNHGHELYNLGYDGNYNDNMINITNNLIESITLKKSKYCINDDKNRIEKKVCSKNKMNTILSTLKEPSITDLKTGLVKGAIISYELESFDYKTLNIVVNTILSRGYNIDYLYNVLSEKRN